MAENTNETPASTLDKVQKGLEQSKLVETQENAEDTNKETKDTSKDTSKEISDAESKLLAEAMKKKEKLKEQAKLLEEKDAQLKKYEGVDVEEYKKYLVEKELAKKKADEAEEERLKKEGDFESLKKQIVTENQKKVEEAVKLANLKEMENTQLKEVYNAEKLENVFNTSKFIKDDVILSASHMKKLYGEHFEVIDGSVVAFDKPKGSKDRTELVNASGERLGFEEAIGKIIENDADKDKVLKSKMKTGSGSTISIGVDKFSVVKNGISSYDKIKEGLKESKII